MASLGALRRFDSQGNWVTIGHTIVTVQDEAALPGLVTDAEVGQTVFCEAEGTAWIFDGTAHIPVGSGGAWNLLQHEEGTGNATVTLDMDHTVYKEFEIRFQIDNSPLSITLDGATVWLGVQHSSKSASSGYQRNVAGNVAEQYAPDALHTGAFEFSGVVHEMHLKIFTSTGTPPSSEVIVVDAVGEGRVINQLVFNIIGPAARYDVVLLGLQ